MNANKYTEYSFLQSMARDLLKARKSNYSQETINFYITPEKFYVQDISQIHNHFNNNLKCTLIKHTTTVFQQAKRDSSINSKCIIYLHGLGSNRLQAFSILPYLPKTYCLLAFDMSGSGKSQGDNITYGYRQKDDIQPIIEYLYLKKKIGQFVLWGRSMGAVAALLYSISLNQKNVQNVQDSTLKRKIKKQQLIKCIVIDSPFCSFREIAQEIGLNKLSIPKFVSEVAIKILNSVFEKLLYNKLQEKSYNPFQIQFNKKIQTSMPAIFIHSMNDQIVPYHHSQKIIQLFSNKFQKIIIPECGHNVNRPRQVVDLIFQKLNKFIQKKTEQNKRKYSLNIEKNYSKQNINPKNISKKRGISVFTSLQKNNNISPKKCTKQFNLDLQETKKKPLDQKINLGLTFKRRRTSDLKLKVVNSMKNLEIQNQKDIKYNLQFSTISFDNQIYDKKDKYQQRSIKQILEGNYLNTIDVDMQGIINKKLQFNFNKKQNQKISRIYRQKRIKTLKTIDHQKITNDKYLY